MSVLIPTMIGKHHLKLDMPGEFSNKVLQKCLTTTVFKTVVYTNSSDSFKYYEFTDAENAAEFDAYVAKCKELSLYDTGVSAEYGDKLISLSTCEYSRNNGRLVVVAKRVD